MQNRRLSTYINELAEAGFLVERLIEETAPEILSHPAECSSKYYAPWRALKQPLSFVIKARKI